MHELGRLSGVELKIMEKIWEIGSNVTVALMLALFESDKSWKAQTMSTFLTRLVDKGFLNRKTEGKTNIFTALISKNEYVGMETSGFLSTVHGGSIKSFLTALVDTTSLSTSELDEIQQWLDKGGFE